MKKKYILSSLAVLSVLAVAAGATSVLAAGSGANSSVNKFKERPAQLTEAQKTEMKTKIDAVKSALESGDYTAWTAATKALDIDSSLLSKVTADNFSSYAAKYKEGETKMTEMKTKMEAVQTALTAGDYTAWVAAEKSIDENSVLLTKITADNFGKYAEANKLRLQADSIMKELGVSGGAGFGSGRGHNGIGRGGMGGEMMGLMLGANGK